MNDEVLNEKEKQLLGKILLIESEAINSITKIDNKVIVSKIISAYEEMNKNADK